MSSTFLTLLPFVQGLLTIDDAGLQLPSGLATTSLLGLVDLINPIWADGVTNSLANLGDLSGQVVISAGVFEADLALGDNALFQGSLDAPATLTQLAALAAGTSGTATLANGLLNGSLTNGDDTFLIEDLDVATLASDFVLTTLTAIDATAEFSNGAFSFATDSLFGPLSGLIDVAGGDLNIDLTTPFGPFSLDVPFGDSARIPIDLGASVLGPLSGNIDFSTGLISASLPTFGITATVPITDFSGTLALDNGVLSIDSAFPVATGIPFLGTILVPLYAEFEIGPLASQAVADLVQDLTADVVLADGTLDMVGSGPLGAFDTSFDLVAFTNQGAEFFAGVDGVLGIGAGQLTADLTTPLGPVAGTFDLGSVAGFLDAPLETLV